MKFSVYEFTDLTRTYGIVEFDDEEYSELISKLNKDISDLYLIFTKLLGPIKSFKLAKGAMIYDKNPYTLIYISIELEDNDLFTFEIYPNSMSVESNTRALKVMNVVKTLAREFIGRKLKESRGALGVV